VHLTAGQHFTLTTKDVEGDALRCSISFKNLPADVTKGTKILIDDGLVSLRVEETNAEDIDCVVLNDGEISDNKGVNVPGASLSMPFISDRDRSDLHFRHRERLRLHRRVLHAQRGGYRRHAADTRG
jgi:pyruvate kinase